METHDSVDLHTLEYIFRVQQTLSSVSRKRSTNVDNKHIAAYFGWHLNNRIEQCEQDNNSQKKVSSVKNKSLSEVTDRCGNCNSILVNYRSIPKKLKQKKQKKKGVNYDTNLINARCEFCKSRVKFNGLKKTDKIVGIVKKPNSTNQQKLNFSINNSSNVDRKAQGLKTPTSTKSHKEALQKLLSDSKKKRNLDSKTRLSDFLSSCFNKWTLLSHFH